MIVGEAVAQPMGDRQHPVAHGHVGRDDVLHQVRRPLGHPPPAAARTEAAALARERHEPPKRAVATAYPGEPVRQDPAAQELPELGGNERRQATPVGALRDRREEVGQMPANHPVETPLVGERGT